MTDENRIYRSPSEDPEMEQAGLRARQTFRYFWREMSWEHRRIVPALELAAVKATFTDPPEMRDPEGLEAEHMWLLEVDFDGRELSGTLINQPHSLRSVSEGDEVKIPAQQICDWMYARSGEVYGGFTIDLLRSRMSKGERIEHDQAWGFDFGEVGIVDLVPPDFIGQSRPKKGFFSRLFGGAKAEPQDHAAVAAAEHPMSVNMRESLSETLTENPNYLTEGDNHGYTFLHQLALAGSYDGVDVCLKHGANPNAAAPNGMTPLALAKALGWQRVTARLQQAGAE